MDGGRDQRLKCPVCGARFRGTESCSRCGTDLTALMKLAIAAHRDRAAARRALAAGDLFRALQFSAEADTKFR